MSKEQSDYYIKSIKKAIRIIQLLTYKKGGFGITEISKKLKMHKSTVYRILITLESDGFIIKNLEREKYCLGSKLFELGQIFQEHIELREIAIPYMKDIVEKSGESVTLNIVLENKRITIEKVEGKHTIREFTRLGKSYPLYCGASSKALLAFMSDEEIDNILNKERLIPFTPYTIVDPNKLKENLKEIREKGYASSMEEFTIGAYSISCPILSYQNKLVGSLSILQPTIRYDEQTIPKFIYWIKTAGREISAKYYSLNNHSIFDSYVIK